MMHQQVGQDNSSGPVPAWKLRERMKNSRHKLARTQGSRNLSATTKTKDVSDDPSLPPAFQFLQKKKTSTSPQRPSRARSSPQRPSRARSFKKIFSKSHHQPEKQQEQTSSSSSSTSLQKATKFGLHHTSHGEKPDTDKRLVHDSSASTIDTTSSSTGSSICSNEMQPIMENLPSNASSCHVVSTTTAKPSPPKRKVLRPRTLTFKEVSCVAEGWHKMQKTNNYEEVVGRTILRRFMEVDPEIKTVLGIEVDAEVTEESLVNNERVNRSARAVVNMIDTAIDFLGPDRDLLTDLLRDMDDELVRAGVKRSQYPAAAAAMFDVACELLGPSYMKEAEEKHWKTVLKLTCGMLMRFGNGNRQ